MTCKQGWLKFKVFDLTSKYLFFSSNYWFLKLWLLKNLWRWLVCVAIYLFVSTGIELTKSEPTFTWSFEDEDDDEDYMINTLFLKTAVLSNSALKGERNIIQVETKNFEKKDIKQPLLSLTLGQLDMVSWIIIIYIIIIIYLFF